MQRMFKSVKNTYTSSNKVQVKDLTSKEVEDALEVVYWFITPAKKSVLRSYMNYLKEYERDLAQHPTGYTLVASYFTQNDKVNFYSKLWELAANLDEVEFLVEVRRLAKELPANSRLRNHLMGAVSESINRFDTAKNLIGVGMLACAGLSAILIHEPLLCATLFVTSEAIMASLWCHLNSYSVPPDPEIKARMGS